MAGPLLLLLIARISVAAAAEKHWLPDVDWLNPANWRNGELPSSESHVVFPLEMRHALGMPRDLVTVLAGVELTRDGVLGLPQRGRIEVSEVAKASASWIRDGPFFWVDPDNWNGTSEATPHVERLPCQADLAVLPSSKRTFSMRMPITRELELRAVRLEDDNFTLSRWAWRDMSDRAEFIGDFSVKYSPLECKDCKCQEGDMSAYWEEVCNVQRPRCGLLACDKPLEVEGHCCFYCGGRIRLSKKTLLGTVQRVANGVLKRYENTLFWHSRTTWDGQREILVTERGTYEGTNTLIALADLEAALRGERVEVLYSEASGDALRDNRLAFALGPVFGGLLALVIFTLLLCPLFGYTFAQIWEGCREFGRALWSARSDAARKDKFGFARFENVPEAGLQLVRESGPSETFENPLYGPARLTSLDPRRPVSLATLERAIELERMEDVEMDIENL